MDRDDTLRRAEKLLRQGRLDAAIEEYAKLVEETPRDWSTANVLGDLYVRAGQIDQAVAQYTRIAEHLAREGFVSRATALYKKIVKIHPDDDAALRRAAELSASQGLTAEARLHLHALFQQRVRRGDRAGAVGAAALLAELDPGNAAGRVESARLLASVNDAAGAAAQLRAAGQAYLTAGKPEQALQAWRDALGHNPDDEVTSGLLVEILLEAGDPDGATEVAKTAAHWRAVAGGFTRAGRPDAASSALEKVLEADPSDVPSRVHLAREAMAQHDGARARELLATLSGSTDPIVLLAQAEVDLRFESIERGRAALTRSLASCGDLAQPAIDLGCDIGRTAPEIGFAVITAVVQHAESGGDSDLALDAIERFVAVAPGDVAALEELIRISGQGFYENQRYRAQIQLADAYLSRKRWQEARSLAEQLVKARPDDGSHVQRLGRALTGLGVPDGEAAALEHVRQAAAPPAVTADFASPVPARSALTEDRSFADVASLPALWAMPSGDPPPALLDPPDAGGAAAEWVTEPAGPEAEAAIDLDAVLEGSRRRPNPAATERDVFEIDLSGELDDLLNVAQARPDPSAAPPPPPAEHRGGLDGYFEELRGQRGRDLDGVNSALAYDQASEYFNRGEVDSAMACLRTAARDPLYRFRAASMLARIARDQGRLGEAVEWLERAVESPAPSVEASRSLLYELGDALDAGGEDARALAVFIELESSAPGYRDVGERVADLAAREGRRPGPRKGLR